MLIPIVFVVCIVVVVALVIAGLSLQRKFTQKENLHRELARRLSLHIAYTSEKDFTIFGRFRDYPVKVIPFDKIVKPACLCFSVPMINPNLKWLKISKNLSENLEAITQNDKSIQVNHDLDTDIRIETNDMMFSGLLLSENVKISIHDTFKEVTEAILYIDGENMNFVMPRQIKAEQDILLSTKIIHLMCDMKDELN
ncbi:MAG: hypothetical protein R3D00_15995 [Bacteroidia bacterium]